MEAAVTASDATPPTARSRPRRAIPPAVRGASIVSAASACSESWEASRNLWFVRRHVGGHVHDREHGAAKSTADAAPL